jgi:hypothetical protein
MAKTIASDSFGRFSAVSRAAILLLPAALLTCWTASSARADAPPPPQVSVTTPGDETIWDGTPLSMVYQFYNPNTAPPVTFSVNVAPVAKTDFYGPEGAAAGDVAELAAFPGYQAAIAPGQYGEFTLNFTTTGSDDRDSDSWWFSMPAIAYEFSAYGYNYRGGGFGTPIVTLVDTPEPAALVLLGAGAMSLAAYFWRRRKPAA